MFWEKFGFSSEICQTGLNVFYFICTNQTKSQQIKLNVGFW